MNEARDAVARCHGAGIRPVMITGDHPATAAAIALELGIASHDSETVSGQQLDDITDEAKEAARTAPPKLRVSLPKEREDRYQRMRAAMEKFIRANAKRDPEAMIAGIANNEKRAIAGLTSCQSDDFKLARQAIDQLTDFSNERQVNETLKVPRDPQRGTCG